MVSTVGDKMLRYKPVLLLKVLVLATFTSAIGDLGGDNTEWVYKYKALIRAGTHIPASYGSQFTLEGKLHVQIGRNDTHFKLEDLSYKIYNGPIDYVQERNVNEVPLPQEVSDLMKVFRVDYDQQGHAVGISTDQNEHEYTINMKKAIASIWQLDVENVINVQEPHNFITNEDSIYSNHEVNYNVQPSENYITVQKMHELTDNHYIATNINDVPVEVHHLGPASRVVHHNYGISKEGDKHIIKYIESTSEIMYHPFNHDSDSQFVFVMQKFDFIESLPIKDHYKVESEHFSDSLTYHMYMQDEPKHIMDFTNGRMLVNWETMMPKVEQMMKEMWEYAEGSHIDAHQPDMKQAQSVNRLVRLLQRFDREKIEELHTLMKAKTTQEDLNALKVFYSVLPLVGTHAAALSIKNIVKEGKVGGQMRIHLMKEFSKNMHFPPSRELVEQMKEILEFTQSTPKALLFFASLVGRAYEHEMYEHHSDTHDHEITAYYDQYVIKYVDMVKTNTENSKTALVALQNMKVPTILTKHFVEELNNKWWSEDKHDILLTTMWTMRPLVQKHPEAAREVFWPIMSNNKLPATLRMSAYYMIMESRPSKSTMMDVFWMMQKETNPEVYHFHYSYFNSRKHSTEPCHAITKEIIEQLFRYMPPALHGISTYDVADFKDPIFNFGSGLHTIFMEDDKTKYLAAFDTRHVHEFTEKMFMSVKMHGFPKIQDVFKLVTGTNIESIVNIKKIFEVFTQWPPGAHIEITVSSNQQVETHFVVDNTEWNLVLDKLMKEKTDTSFEVHYEDYFQKYIPTDMGIPVVLEYLSPKVHKATKTSEMSQPMPTVMTHHIKMRSVFWSSSRQGLSFYNPILDAWQGVNKYITKDSVVPTQFETSIDLGNSKFKTSMIVRDEDEKYNVMIERYHVTSMVFVKDDHHRENLLPRGEHVGNWVVVSHGQEYRHNMTGKEENYIMIGNQGKMVYFDTENTVPRSEHLTMVYNALSPHDKNFRDPISHFWLFVLHWTQLQKESPYHGTYGVFNKIEPSNENSATKLDLTIIWHNEINHVDHMYAPEMKHNLDIIYELKNHEQVLKTWHVIAHADLNDGHTINKFKVDVTRKIPEKQDYKICVEAENKYTFDGIEGHMNMLMGQTPDEKCVKDDTVIDLKMYGKPHDSQTSESHVYGACVYSKPHLAYNKLSHHTMECLQEHTNVHKYTYEIKTNNVPSVFKDYMVYWWDILKSINIAHYEMEHEHGVKMDDHDIKLEVVYSLDGEHVDVHLYEPQKVHSLKGVTVSREYLRYLGIELDSTVYPVWYSPLHAADLVDHCVVFKDHLVYQHHRVNQTVPNEWMMMIGDRDQDPKNAVYVKQLAANKLAVKVLHDTHNLEITSSVDGHHVYKKDGQPVNMVQDKFAEEWISMFVMREEPTHPVVIYLPHFGFNVEYNMDSVHVTIPKVDMQLGGHCVANKM